VLARDDYSALVDNRPATRARQVLDRVLASLPSAEPPVELVDSWTEGDGLGLASSTDSPSTTTTL
jgi:hypothetical protein